MENSKRVFKIIGFLISYYYHSTVKHGMKHGIMEKSVEGKISIFEMYLVYLLISSNKFPSLRFSNQGTLSIIPVFHSAQIKDGFIVIPEDVNLPLINRLLPGRSR